MDKHYTMKQLPVSEQPDAKLEKYGASSLSDAELLAVIIRTGAGGTRSVDVACEILQSHQFHKGLLGLHYLTMKDLLKIRGIGKVKAIQLLCIAELTKRISQSHRQDSVCFRCSKDIADYFMEEMRVLTAEQVRLLLLDGKSRLIRSVVITVGTVNSSIASPREIMKTALNYDAVNIILMHNHPSGDATPSSEDLVITNRLLEAGQLIGIPLMDHIIIGDGQFTSLRDQGLLY